MKIPTQIKYLVFDFDGVIAETDRARFSCLARILQEYHIDLKKKYAPAELTGLSTDVFLRRNFPFLQQTQIEEIVTRRRKEYFNDLEATCVIYPGARQTLVNLKKAGFILFLATTNWQQVIEKLLEFLKLQRIFRELYPRERIVNQSTGEKDYTLFLQQSNLPLATIAVVEDSLIGIQSARKNRLFCIAFNASDNKKLAPHVDLSVHDYAELAELFMA